MSKKTEYVSNKEQERDKEELENLKLGYEQCQENYRNQQSRHKSADEKLNMLLVFNGAIVALLIIILPIDKLSITKVILNYIFLLLFAISMITTLVFIIIGLFPRKTTFVDNETYVNPKLYQCTNYEFYGKFIALYKEANKNFCEVIEKKHLYGKRAMVITFFNIIFIFALIIIKII